MRNVQKSIDEYEERFVQQKTDHGGFFLSDYQQLIESANSELDLLDKAIKFGFMVGMRYGMKKAKQAS